MDILPIDPTSVLSADAIGDPQLLDLVMDATFHQGPKLITAIGILLITRWGVQRGIHIIDRLIESLEDTLQKFLLQALAAIVWLMGDWRH